MNENKAKNILEKLYDKQLENFDCICPRCGKKMREDLYTNALSRRVNVYICPECGLQEAAEDFVSKQIQLTEWEYIRNLQ